MIRWSYHGNMAFIASRILLAGLSLSVSIWLVTGIVCLQTSRGGVSQTPLSSNPETAGDYNVSVGFSLQSSYGAATAIFDFDNGVRHTYSLSHTGDESYGEVMARLSLDSSKHLAPPYGMNDEYIRDQPRRFARECWKRLGFAASRDVGVLAKMTQKLQSDVESTFRIQVSEAVFTTSHLVALYQDDLTDMADYIGIKYVTPKHQFKPIFWEVGAAYAGYGLGLCESWQDEERCNDENGELPDIWLLAIHYSKNALTTSLAKIQVATSPSEFDGQHEENFSLGSDDIAKYLNPEEYWIDVRETLLKQLRENPFSPPEKIMITGDQPCLEFMNLLEEVLVEHLGYFPPVLKTDASLMASRGAAELMRRGAAPWS